MARITHLFDDVHTTYFWGAKGGVGTSTVAALHALALARAGRPTTLAAANGDHGELAALLGVADTDRPLDANAVAGMQRPAGPTVVVVDGGTNPAPERAVTRRVLVVRPCYLAVRRALHAGMGDTDGIVIVEEPARSLTRADIEGILARPVLAAVAVTADLARLIDAGLLALRTPGLALAGREPASATT